MTQNNLLVRHFRNFILKDIRCAKYTISNYTRKYRISLNDSKYFGHETHTILIYIPIKSLNLCVHMATVYVNDSDIQIINFLLKQEIDGVPSTRLRSDFFYDPCYETFDLHDPDSINKVENYLSDMLR